MSRVITKSRRVIATFTVVVGFLTWCEAQYTVGYAEVRNARALSGSVNDQGGSAVPDVHVSEMSCDWKAQLRSTTTDPQGKWSLSPFVRGKTYCVEFAKLNFNPVRVRVKITKSASQNLVIQLPVAT
jgi:hypothetical protein